MSFLGEADIEGLLTREARARLPFLRLVRIYLDPGALFMDATRGTAITRQRALAYNRRMRWMLLAYMRRWGVIAAFLIFAIEPAQAMSWIPAAACAVTGSIAVTVIAVTLVAYWLLGAPES
jgi:hypothetical protein